MTEAKYRPIIAIDFDMTISNNKNYKVLENPPMPHALSVIKILHDMGCILILWTCRGGDTLQTAKDYLAKYDILKYFSYFNENTSDVLQDFEDSSRKIYADVYVDDKNVGGFIGWDAVLAHVMQLDFFKNLDNWVSGHLLGDNE